MATPTLNPAFEALYQQELKRIKQAQLERAAALNITGLWPGFFKACTNQPSPAEKLKS